jgi:hypothetical protein
VCSCCEILRVVMWGARCSYVLTVNICLSGKHLDCATLFHSIFSIWMKRHAVNRKWTASFVFACIRLVCISKCVSAAGTGNVTKSVPPAPPIDPNLRRCQHHSTHIQPPIISYVFLMRTICKKMRMVAHSPHCTPFPPARAYITCTPPIVYCKMLPIWALD